MNNNSRGNTIQLITASSASTVKVNLPPAASMVSTVASSNVATSTIANVATPDPTSPYSPASGALTHNSVRSDSHSLHLPPTDMDRSTSTATILATPKKQHFQALREILKTPSGVCELRTLRMENGVAATPAANVFKNRYLISSLPSQISTAAVAKTPASYRHLIDLTSSNLRCTDIITGEQFLCKIVNEPLHKVQLAYYQLQNDDELYESKIYNHNLIRRVHDILPLSKERCYLVISTKATTTALPTRSRKRKASDNVTSPANTNAHCIYEDLHTYIRNKRRLSEMEARALFHQICQTVLVCHRNGIILRDLKLKRFFFIDEERTKLQYESLEGAMILEEPADDTLSDKIGCPLYTAPELLCPNPTYRGKPADMWSLGVILYTMLVGQYPFYEKGNCNLITIIRHSQVQIPASLSRSVRWLLLSLLHRNYEDRMQAEDIFLQPWLREQRPYYMYVPVNAYFSSSDEESSDEESSDIEDEVTQKERCKNDEKQMKSEESSRHNHRVQNAPSTEKEESGETSIGPLDYTRSALQTNCVNDDGNGEMG